MIYTTYSFSIALSNSAIGFRIRPPDKWLGGPIALYSAAIKKLIYFLIMICNKFDQYYALVISNLLGLLRAMNRTSCMSYPEQKLADYVILARGWLRTQRQQYSIHDGVWTLLSTWPQIKERLLSEWQKGTPVF